MELAVFSFPISSQYDIAENKTIVFKVIVLPNLRILWIRKSSLKLVKCLDLSEKLCHKHKYDALRSHRTLQRYCN